MNIFTLRVLYRYLYWSVQGPSGGIFQLDLTLAKAGSCVSPASNVVNIIFNYSVNCMTLNLDDPLLYFAPGSVNLSSVSLEDGQIVNYPHDFTIVDARSIASYNEYLVVPALMDDDNDDLSALFVKIRQQDSTQSIVIVTTTPPTDTNHVFIIREDFQPSPDTYCIYGIIIVRQWRSQTKCDGRAQHNPMYTI